MGTKEQKDLHKAQQIKRQIELINSIEKNTSVDIPNLLEIPLNRYYDLKRLSPERITRLYSSNEVLDYLDLLDTEYKEVFDRAKEFELISVTQRTKDLISVLSNYYNNSALGRYIDISATHVRRIRISEKPIKIGFLKFVKLEELYFKTNISEEDVLPYYAEKENDKSEQVNLSKKVSKYKNIEEREGFKRYSLTFLKREIPLIFDKLLNNHRMSTITKRLEMSSGYIYNVRALKVGNRSLNRVYNMLLIEFESDLAS